MGFGRQRAHTHARRVESLDHAAGGFDFVQRNRRAGLPARLQQIAQHGGFALIDQRRRPSIGVRFGQHGGLQRADHIGVVAVVLATMDVLEQATGFEIECWIESARRELLLIGFQRGIARTTDATRRARETALHDGCVQPDDLEQGRAAIAGDGADTHLGENLQQANANTAPVRASEFAMLGTACFGVHAAG